MRGTGKTDGLGDSRTTPPQVWRLLLAAAGLEQWTLDPFSNPHSSIPARVSFDGTPGGGDGLGPLYWLGDVFINPPFSKMLACVERAFLELDPPSGRPGLRSLTVLGFASPGTRWHRACVEGCDAFATWDHRVDFPLPGLPVSQPPAAPIVFYGGPDPVRWRRVIEAAGHLTHEGRRGRTS